MSFSSRSTSPDPIALPSSPLGLQSGNARPQRRRSAKPRSSNVPKGSSPSKSIVLDTGKAGDGSPWRIRVTVEAEPKGESSPTKTSKKAVRVTKVPLKSGGNSSSPSKKTIPHNSTTEDDMVAGEISRPPRKRKGTPIRRRGTRMHPATEDIETRVDDEVDVSSNLPSQPPPSWRTPAAAEPTERSKRLSKAREELSIALREAVGEGRTRTPDFDDEGNGDAGPIYDEPGDMTMANEDFTMVSVETLQSMKQNTSQILEQSGYEIGEMSAASVSYMPSSPPFQRQAQDVLEVQYPDISPQAAAARGEASMSAGPINKHYPSEAPMYEDEAWSSTASETAPQSTSSSDSSIDKEDNAQLRRSQHQVSPIERTTTERAIVLEMDASAGAERMEGANGDGGAEDIWAEEASRSIEEEQEHSVAEIRPPQLEDLFADEQPRPLRSKIPRTWRRSSGVHFSYVDSPEYGALRKSPAASTTDGEGVENRSNGVLTPPSTDDEADNSIALIQDGLEEGDTSLTEPDAAATQLQAQNSPEPLERQEALSPLSDSSSSSTSSGNEGEDTGLFWQRHLPNVYRQPTRPRFQRQKRAMDLSELLNLNNSPSPAKESRGTNSDNEPAPVSRPVARQNVRRTAAETMQTLASNSLVSEKVVSSPLRKSLLKSSKIGGSALPAPNTNQASSTSVPCPRTESREDVQSSTLSGSESAQESTLESSGSQASVQRQLRREMREAPSSYDLAPAPNYEWQSSRAVDLGNDRSASNDGSVEEHKEQNGTPNFESTESEVATEDPTRSYEEHLNLDSPQKVKVNFNDSGGDPSLLAPKKQYPPLFGQETPVAAADWEQQATKSPSSVMLVSKKPLAATAEAQPGIFSRLSTTFWSAVIRPSGPAVIMPTEQQPEPVYCHFLRRDIRSRYGVLSEMHPWTMAHMRTLHRLLNSCTSGRSDSLVPRSGPLPSKLEGAVGKMLVSVTPEFTWTFTREHAHVVDAFMQTLVPEHISEAIRIGEMDFLGDYAAKEHRGLVAGRHGDMVVFKDMEDVVEPSGWIYTAWVVKALGNCVMANIETARKERLSNDMC